MSKKLYIIGNGFDIHHGLDTKYSSFGKYLEAQNLELYELVTSYIGFPNEDDDLWYRFETNLANLDVDEILSLETDLLPNIASDDFRDRDRYNFEHAMEEHLEKLTKVLRQEFRNFIEAAKIPDDAIEKKIELDNKAQFLNFNYTDTLQHIYQVDSSNITYIHNAASDQTTQIILGHGINPKEFERTAPVPPQGLTEEELYEWMQDQSDNYDHSYDLGEQMIRGYFSSAFKNTAEIIENNRPFFNSLANVEQVTVLGHSISEVDIKYFVEVVAIAPHSIWSVSYFSDSDKQRITDTFQTLGIAPNKITLFKIADKALNNIQGKLSL